VSVSAQVWRERIAEVRADRRAFEERWLAALAVAANFKPVAFVVAPDDDETLQ